MELKKKDNLKNETRAGDRGSIDRVSYDMQGFLGSIPSTPFNRMW